MRAHVGPTSVTGPVKNTSVPSCEKFYIYCTLSAEISAALLSAVHTEVPKTISSGSGAAPSAGFRNDSALKWSQECFTRLPCVAIDCVGK